MALPISIVLPVYNGEPYLAECIVSVLGQSLPEFELLVADDGSTDGSIRVLKGFTDPRVRVLNPEPRKKLFGNLNRLFAEAKSPIVKILCQDDRLEPDCLSDTVRFFARHREIGMLFSKWYTIDPRGKVIEQSTLGDLPDVMSIPLSLQHLFYHGCIPGNLSTVSVRRECWKEVGGFDESMLISADYDMWARISALRPMGVIQAHTVQVRLHDKQLSALKSSGIPYVRENRRVRHALLPKLPVRIQRGALRFEKMRHHVLEFHFGIRALLAGHVGIFFRLARVFGFRGWMESAFWWLWTLNNRRFRPPPDFELSPAEHEFERARASGVA